MDNDISALEHLPAETEDDAFAAAHRSCGHTCGSETITIITHTSR
ncbi:hypothetical protein [Actinacidiphila bryophytorum]|jgi:hypothetical protein|nr:hypothetical protein [Actinacidiphila bryophytorum]UWE11373.1 hypothetical protein NYE86_23410 [Actinacidiphila bryophytorum]